MHCGWFECILSMEDKELTKRNPPLVRTDLDQVAGLGFECIPSTGDKELTKRNPPIVRKDLD
jgi:hypothetical protein